MFPLLLFPQKQQSSKLFVMTFQLIFKMHQKKYSSLLISFIFLLGYPTFGQSSPTYEKQFDEVFGKENLGINNGPLYSRDYPNVVEGKDKYFLNNEFSLGTVTYEDQSYSDVLLKYDLYDDLLIYNPPNAPTSIGVALIFEKVDSFHLHEKKFVNITKTPVVKDNNKLAGYWQLVEISPTLSLYIKHKKNQNKVIKDRTVYYSYEVGYTFLVVDESGYQMLSSKNDLNKLFEGQASKIDAFYVTHKKMLQNNPPLFYEALLRHLTSTRN